MYQTVVGIICHNNKILFFQRDDIPSIPDPGKWQTPGGHVDEGETSDIAIKRELIEEVGHCPKNLKHIGTRKTDKVETFVYWCRVDENEVKKFSLNSDEGQALKFMTIQEALKHDLTPSVKYYLENFKQIINKHLKAKTTPSQSDFGV